MTQPDENPPPHNPESPLDQLGDIGLTFADGLPAGPLTDAQKNADYSMFSDEEIAMFTASALTAASVDSTTGEEHTGAMIALVPSSDDKLRMAIPDGEPADQLHTTLLFLGEVADIPEDAQALILDWAKTFAEGRVQIAGNGFALALFNPASENPCWVIEIGEVVGDETPLQDVQSVTASAMANVPGLTVPPQHTPWRPHITLIYDGSIDWAYELVDAAGPVTYDVLRVALGGVVTDFNLLTPSLPDDTTLYSATTEHGGVTMSYHAALRAECPEGLPWAVVRDSDGAILTAHDTRAAAESLIDTVGRYELTGGTVSFVAGIPKFSPGAQTYAVEVAPAPPASGTGDAANADGAVNPVGSWEAILALEGTPTGDGRQFATGSLTWADLPIPLLWQKQVIGEGHMGQVTAGSITEVWRDGNMVKGRGTFDLNGMDGAEAYRQVREGFLKGLSIDPDSISDADVEYVYPAEDAGAEDEMLDLFGPAPELTIFHAGRIRATTLVQIPAFVEAQLWLTDGQQVNLSMASPAASGGVDETHYSGYVDGTWDAPANQARLARAITPETAAAAFAYVSPLRNEFGQVARGASLFLHHEVNEQGQPSLANITAVTAAIAAVNTATHLAGDVRHAAYEHLARHVRAAGLTPLPFVPTSTLIAASHTIVIEDVPPAAWFEEPTDVPSYGALTVTDQGRVYGYLAPSKVAHRSFVDRTVFVPMKTVDYSRFLGRETIVAGGDRVRTGCITMNCGHASTDPRVGGDGAMDHYDNSCSIVANINVGENDHGVWVAGALLPDVDADQVARMMSCQLSGDWRPLGQAVRGKSSELAAALLVPVPGFPMARTRPSVRATDEGQLVASSVPVRFVRGIEHRDNPLHNVAQRVARGIGRDTASRAAQLKARIHGR